MPCLPLLRRSALLALALPALLTDCVGGGRTVHTVERSFPLGEVDLLLLDDGAGDLEIVGEPDRDNVTLIARLKSYRASEANDKAAEHAMRVDLRSLDDATSRIIASLHDPPAGYFIDLVVLTPMDVAMQIQDRSGDIHIEGIAALDLDDGSGDVDIEDVSGDVVVDDGSGDLVVRGVGGTLDIVDDSGDIAVFSVAGKTKIHDGSGDMALHDLGHVVIDDGSGDIAAIHCDDVDVRSDGSGDVAIEH